MRAGMTGGLATAAAPATPGLASPQSAAPATLPDPFPLRRNAFLVRLGAPQAPGPDWSWQVLPRHGLRPIGFFGCTLLTVTAEAEQGWMSLRLLDIAGGGAAAALAWCLPGGGAWRHAFAAATPGGLAAALHAFRPAALPLRTGAHVPDAAAAWSALRRVLAAPP